ncbi:kinase-like protein, partial [Morchella conica CCBAS932]
LYITMEYLENGDLSVYLKTQGRLPEGTILNIITQVLHGLVVLHERNICHRDLKPQNILIASPRPLRVKIADFGTSKYIKETEVRTRVGTVEYTAPEVLGLWTSKTRRNHFPYALDIWSMGCIFYEMITSKRPFTLVHLTSTAISTLIAEAETALETGVEAGEEMDMQLFLKFCSGAMPLPLEEFERLGASKEAGLFVKAVLQADPSMRPSALECLEEAKRMIDI